MVYQDRGSCRCQTLPKILGYSLMTYSEPRSICFVLFNIRIPAAHSAFILSHHSLGLTLLPSRLILCMSGPTRGRCGVRNLPCRLRLYLRIGYRPFHSIGLSVSFDAVSIRYTYRLAPWLLYLLSDLNKCFCLLTGIISIRPSAFVEGEGIEPTLILLLLARCTFYGSLPSKSYPDDYCSSFIKTCGPRGWQGIIVKLHY